MTAYPLKVEVLPSAAHRLQDAILAEMHTLAEDLCFPGTPEELPEDHWTTVVMNADGDPCLCVRSPEAFAQLAVNETLLGMGLTCGPWHFRLGAKEAQLR